MTSTAQRLDTPTEPTIAERTAALLENLRNAQTMPDLDALRKETAALMVGDVSKAQFDLVQGNFKKARNRLHRVPLSDRKGR